MLDGPFRIVIHTLLLARASSSSSQTDSFLREEYNSSSECPSFCPFVWNPVCGSDDTTYDNACHLQAASCYKNRVLTLKYGGICRERFPNEASCLLWRHCSQSAKPQAVCGSDGGTYLSTCQMMQESCRKNSTIIEIPCSKIDPRNRNSLVPLYENPGVDPFTAYLNIRPSEDASRISEDDGVGYANSDRCFEALSCSKLYLPVCGSDGETYGNECLLQGWSRCRRRNTLFKAFAGDCQTRIKDISEACKGFETSSCPDVDDPICGKDGRNYANECHMMRRSCEEGFLIGKRHEGHCQASKRQKKQTYNTLKKCPFACNLIYKPVCGSDGQTYANQCQFESKNCVSSNRLLVIVAEGPCSEQDFEFEAAISEEEDEECPKFCTFEFMPVCGLDGLTYSNKCQLRLQACETETNIEVDHPGQCEDPFEAVESEEGDEEEGVEVYGPNSPCPVYCTFTFEEICGSDDVTYRNACHLKYQSCLYPEEQLKKAYDGPCTSDNKLKNALQNCPQECPNDYNPICGSDGDTYVNKCRLRLKNCVFFNATRSISIAYYGSCLYDCPDYCPTKYDPVCGSDMITYVNECHLSASNCREAGKYIFLLDTGECETARQTDIYEQRRSIDLNFVFSDALDERGGCEGKGRVCGSDGRTYESFCEIIEANRGRKEKIFKVYEGPCICPEVCPFDLQPVCGSDGIIYPNLCSFQVKLCSLHEEGRNVSTDIGIRLTGEACRSLMISSSSNSSKARELADCMKSLPDFCGTEIDPVCGSDGKSYGNVCQMKRQGCLSGNSEVEVYHFGLCYCKRRNAHCTVSTDKPFCGNEGHRVYYNLCDLEFKICENMATTSSPSIIPLIRSQNGSCTMPKELSYCGLMRCQNWPQRPVCASNGITFANECYFKKHKCFQVLSMEERLSELSLDEFASLEDLKLVKEGPCEAERRTLLLREDYYNDEESFMDPRLKGYLKDMLHDLKPETNDLDLYRLIDIRLNADKVNAEVVLRDCDKSGCKYTKCQMERSIEDGEEEALNQKECFEIEESQIDDDLLGEGEMAKSGEACGPDGRFYYTKNSMDQNPPVNDSSTNKCCPECGNSFEGDHKMVCGSDRISYVSKCQLKRYICLQEPRKRDLLFLHNGPCIKERDIIAEWRSSHIRNEKITDGLEAALAQESSSKYPRWTLRGSQVHGPKTHILYLLENLCTGEESSRDHCRSSLYGQRRMMCKVGSQEDRIVYEDCQILGILSNGSSHRIHEAALMAVGLISEDFNDTKEWMLTSIGRTRLESVPSGELLSIYITMTRREDCGSEPSCLARDDSPVNFCDVQISKSPTRMKLLHKICAGYKVEQFFDNSS